MNAPLEQAVRDLIISCRLPAQRDQQGLQDFGSPETAALGEALSESTSDDHREAMEALAEALSTCAPFGARRLAVYLGAWVEGGRDPLVSGPAVIDLLRAQLDVLAGIVSRQPEGLRVNDLNDLPWLDDEQRETIRALEFVAQSTVSHLVRLPKMREQLRDDADFMKRLEEVNGVHFGAVWVSSLLAQQSGEIVVIAPQDEAGFRVRYRNLGNNFHLFTLLHEALGPELGHDVSGRAEVFEAARGARGCNAEMHDAALWNFSHFGALGPAGNSALQWVWGEMSVTGIPPIDGSPLLLLMPRTAGRTWDAGFYGPQLHQTPPSVAIVERLPPAEVARWIERATEKAQPPDITPRPAPLPNAGQREDPPSLPVAPDPPRLRKAWWKFW